jgi:lauroyl/myristoyl acyltransferase
MSARPPGKRPSRSFRGGDIREAILQGLSAASVRSLPEPGWMQANKLLARLSVSKSTRRRERFRRSVTAVLGDAYGEMAADIQWRTALQEERQRIYVAALAAGKAWTPSIELTGLDEISGARGRGTVIWFDNLIHYPVVAHMAFSQAGIALAQLARHDHGISTTAFGVRFINRRQIAVEDRYFGQRIVFDAGSLVTATRRLVRLLDQGSIVSITNNASLGHAVAIPFGERAVLRVATTPLKLAIQRRAAIFPVSVVETRPLKSYRVAIGPALSAPDIGAADPLASMLANYADYLLPLVRAYPDQWANWRAIA